MRSGVIGFIALLAMGVLTSFVLAEKENEWVTAKVRSGDGVIQFLKRYQLWEESCHRKSFVEINGIADDKGLILNRNYKLPVKVYEYNGTSIRSTIGNNDLENARKIEAYNDQLKANGLKAGDYRKDKVLWVPLMYLGCKDEIVHVEEEDVAPVKNIKVPILGKKHEDITILDDKLKDQVFYLVSGHGGPDPGANILIGNHRICEDEYAYDVTLRLARELLRHSAKVYMIIRDKNDGIREGKYLSPDRDERCWKNLAIPLNQVKRLKQRVAAINKLYKEEKKTAVKQRAIVIHVDSRSQREQIDVFFYHHSKSSNGKKLANSIQKTFKDKYNTYQKNRGYHGEVSTRNLYMLTKTLPVTCYIELGNIRHQRDRLRVMLDDNRQALAKWIAEGIMNE